MSDEAQAEQAIRKYLQWLDDPTSIVDVAAIDAADAAARDENDVIAKLKAISRAEHLRDGDSASVRKAFVAHAKAWGEANEISAASWIRLGVPPEVLREAGVTGNRAGVRSSVPRAQRSKGAGVSVRDIKAHVATLTEPFKLAEVAESVGGSPMTLRKAIDQLVADGTVRRLGPDPQHNGRGRAPIRYETVSG